jgi:hypothetical protein
MNNQLTKIVLALIVLTSSSLALADHHAAPRTIALEAFFCSFEKGKDMDDLLKVTAEWDKWIQKLMTLMLCSLLSTLDQTFRMIIFG